MGKAKVVNYYNDRYQGSLTEEECDILEQLIDLDSSNGCVPDLRHVIYNMDNSDVTNLIEMTEAGGEMLPVFEKKRGTLRNEQTIGVALLYYARNAILGDSVGMGKTVESAGLINLLKADYSKKTEKRNGQFRYLVLTEKNLATQVRFELVKFTGEYVRLIPSGEAKAMNSFLEEFPIELPMSKDVVGTHALLTTPSFLGWLEMYRDYWGYYPFDMIIIDESSVLGNSTTAVTKGFTAISKYFDRIIFLNATPFETSLNIFYNQLNLIDPALLPTKTNFQKEYCLFDYRGMFPKPTGKYKNQEQFKRLVGYRYFARTRKGKGAVMEDCKGGIMLSDLSPVQKFWLNRTQLHRLVFDCPTQLDPDIEFCIENVPKLGSLDELLKTDCAEADSVLIFSHFKEAQACLSKWLTQKGYSNRVLNGDTSNTDRQAIIEGFKSKEFKILVTNVQKGLNFGDCNYCIFYSFDPNPSRMIQFEGRTTRSFDIVGKNVYILCSKGKEFKTFNNVVRQRAKATSEMSTTDLSVVMSILLGDDENVN